MHISVPNTQYKIRNEIKPKHHSEDRQTFKIDGLMTKEYSPPHNALSLLPKRKTTHDCDISIVKSDIFPRL